MVICLERGADLHLAQLMPLPLTVSCFSKIQIGFTFLVPTRPGECSCGTLLGKTNNNKNEGRKQKHENEEMQGEAQR